MPLMPVPMFHPLTVRVNDQRAEYTVSMLDHDDETMLLRMPETCEVAVPERVTFSFANDNAFWELTAPVMAVYDRWWFVQRPQEETRQRRQRRAFVRIHFEAKVTALPLHGVQGTRPDPLPMMTANLSAGGLLARCDAPIGHEGDAVMVMLTLPEMAPIMAESEIVRVQEPHRKEPWTYGLRFRNLREDDMDRVARFVTRRIQHGLRQGRDITCA